MRTGMNRIARLAVVACLLSPTLAFATCNEPDYVPFSGDTKIVCSIDWKTGGERESAMFAPLGGDRWVGWIHAGSYAVQAIAMNATSNSCAGLALVGRRGDFLYRVFVDADSSTILANLEHDDPNRQDRGFGDCKILDETSHEIEVRQSPGGDSD